MSDVKLTPLRCKSIKSNGAKNNNVYFILKLKQILIFQATLANATS